MVAAARAILGDIDAHDPEPLAVVFEIEKEPVTIELEGGQVRVELGATTAPDPVVACDVDTAFARLSGELDIQTATTSGAARSAGDRQAPTRLEPSARARPHRRPMTPVVGPR